MQPKTFTPLTVVWLVLAGALFLAGWNRINSFIEHDPLLAYANSYDMVRLQSCLHVWPVGQKDMVKPEFPAWPREFMNVNSTLGKYCYFSSQLLFAGPALVVGLLDEGHGLSIREFGRVNALVLGAGVLLVMGLLWRARHPAAAAAVALFYWQILGDPANTLYLNTLYTEFSALFFAVLACAAFYRLLAAPAAWHGTAVLWCVALAGLGFSKQQHAVLPLLVAGVLLLFGCLARQRVVAGVALAGLLASLWAPVFWFGNALEDSALFQSIRRMNNHNLYVGAVLPYARDPATAATYFGLSPGCAALAGKSRLQLEVEGRAEEERWCDGVELLSRRQLVGYTLRDPGWLFAATAAGLEKLRPWVIPNMGHVEKERYGRVVAFEPTLSTALDDVPQGVFSLCVLGIWAGGILLVLQAIYRRGKGTSPSLALLGLLGLMSAEIFFVSLAGDGLFDFAKHNHLAFTLGFIFYGTAIMVLLGRLVTIIISRAGHTGGPLKPGRESS